MQALAVSLTLFVVMDLPALCRQQLPGLGQWPRPSPWANIRTLIVGKKTSAGDPLLTENVRFIYVPRSGQASLVARNGSPEQGVSTKRLR